MLTDLPAKVEALHGVAEGFYRRWLDLAFQDQPLRMAPALSA